MRCSSPASLTLVPSRFSTWSWLNPFVSVPRTPRLTLERRRLGGGPEHSRSILLTTARISRKTADEYAGMASNFFQESQGGQLAHQDRDGRDHSRVRPGDEHLWVIQRQRHYQDVFRAGPCAARASDKLGLLERTAGSFTVGTVDREHFCPVCGFDLGFRPWDGPNPSDEICPCCGIQFGYHDAAGGDEKGRGKITPSGARIGSRPVCRGEGVARQRHMAGTLASRSNGLFQGVRTRAVPGGEDGAVERTTKVPFRKTLAASAAGPRPRASTRPAGTGRFRPLA